MKLLRARSGTPVSVSVAVVTWLTVGRFSERAATTQVPAGIAKAATATSAATIPARRARRRSRQSPTTSTRTAAGKSA